ncbi:MAG: SAM-dependent methyltransferase [Candidatus Schekmanbacteria bacterium]|nr:SAM-dependent methyltransferase [Candidatus Schekmanbacteria bacterium]
MGVGLLSSAVLAYEVLLTRLFSIVLWHHFAYMVISLALLGYGASGSALTLCRGAVEKRFRVVFVGAAALFGVTSVGAFAVGQRLSFNPFELLWAPAQPARLLLLYAILAVPFFFAATAIGAALSVCRGGVSALYAADLCGAGAGSLVAIALLTVASPHRALALIGAGGVLAAVVAARELGRARAAPTVVLAAVALAVALAPASWIAPRPSQYKALSQALRVSGAEVVAERSGPLGLVTAVANHKIPFRQAPGMSLATAIEPPEQIALFTDGEGPTVVTRSDLREPLPEYLAYLTSAMPYAVLKPRSVLVLGAGGGSDVLQALRLGARGVDAVELNRHVVELVSGELAGFSGQLYGRRDVTISVAEARGFVAASSKRYDLIQVSLLDSFAVAGGGLYALHESYLYTVEAFELYLQHLTPGGGLAITRWLSLPPRDTLKLANTAIQALARCGLPAPARHLLVIRGWQTTTILVLARPATSDQIARLKTFCAERYFDLAYYPGIALAEANRFNVLDTPVYFEALQELTVSAHRREVFLQRYKFFVAPATDDRPYFFRFLGLRALPELFALRARGGMAMLEWGYLVLLGTLAQALLLSVALILLPLLALRRRAPERCDERRDGVTGAADALRPSCPTRGLRARSLGYFAALGAAFLSLEIAFMQKLILFLSHPLHATAVVLTGFLVFAGIGSACSRRWSGGHAVAMAAAGISALTAVYAFALPAAFSRLLALPEAGRIAVTFAVLAPLAFLMGIPFPKGLEALQRLRPALVPWAWGVNGCASVVTAAGSTLVAIHAGHRAVMLGAAILYGIAAALYPGRGQTSGGGA